jgi:hypothetical protein
MTILYMPDERIPLKVDDLYIEVTQLTQAHKLILMELLSRADVSTESGFEAARKAIQFGVKSIKGIKRSDGSDYEVEVENGILSEECVNALLNLGVTQKMQAVCLSLLAGFNGQCTDLAGNPIPGVSMLKAPASKRRKN